MICLGDGESLLFCKRVRRLWCGGRNHISSLVHASCRSRALATSPTGQPKNHKTNEAKLAPARIGLASLLPRHLAYQIIFSIARRGLSSNLTSLLAPGPLCFLNFFFLPPL